MTRRTGSGQVPTSRTSRPPDGSCANRRVTVSRGGLRSRTADPTGRRRRPGTRGPPGQARAAGRRLPGQGHRSGRRGQVRAAEARIRGSVRHVEAPQVGGVRTPIVGRPRPLPSDRRADRRRSNQHLDRPPIPAGSTPSTVKSPLSLQVTPYPFTVITFQPCEGRSGSTSRARSSSRGGVAELTTTILTADVLSICQRLRGVRDESPR